MLNTICLIVTFPDNLSIYPQTVLGSLFLATQKGILLDLTFTVHFLNTDNYFTCLLYGITFKPHSNPLERYNIC